MTMASNVTYRDLDTSAALNAIIRKRLNKLERYCSDIKHSRVVLDSPHNHKHKGKEFRATVEIDIKGNPINICQNDPSIHIAVRDAFDVAERKLKSRVKQLQSRRNRPAPEIIDDNFDQVAH